MTSAEAQITLVAEHLFIFAFGMTWGPVVWVLLGALANSIVPDFCLSETQRGMMLASYSLRAFAPQLQDG